MSYRSMPTSNRIKYYERKKEVLDPDPQSPVYLISVNTLQTACPSLLEKEVWK